MSTAEGLSTSIFTPTERTRRPRYGRLTTAGLVGVLLLTSCSSGEGNNSNGAPASASADAGPGSDKNTLYKEVVQFDVGSPTFADFRNASGPGKVYSKGTEVTVRCVITNGPKEAAVSADGLWYVANEVQDGHTMYTPANTYVNGSDLSKPLNEQNAYDPAVRHCDPADTAPIPLPS